MEHRSTMKTERQRQHRRACVLTARGPLTKTRAIKGSNFPLRIAKSQFRLGRAEIHVEKELTVRRVPAPDGNPTWFHTWCQLDWL